MDKVFQNQSMEQIVPDQKSTLLRKFAIWFRNFLENAE